ncbi:cupin domain-containing protein [Pannonibacter indicus]|uniref:Predicted sugar epimerase, cupin superfamily n=1 Tax=Pannonibacter indicus TaxID=466044 RepID=A0A0K6I1J1_9HYPH|nr:cupin domain-containing protein [Pannonibacter indicus]CUA96928.1 Predicted sugar epimerase, cupin superfamily [Pannonibacter indicus]
MRPLTGFTAAEIIETLGMQPHPEGGYYAETFRDPVCDASGRAASTAIYFLLPEGVLSRWHKVDAVEVWHWYGGAPLELLISDAEGPVELVTLGSDLAAGQRPQAVVPRHAWQQAQSLGDFTLVGCTVAPGFTFDGFEMAPEGWQP